MNIVYCREKVPIRTHKPFSGSVKDLSTARAFFTVPLVTGASVKTPKLVKQSENIWSFDQRVIMIWQHTPGNNPGDVLLEQMEKRLRKILHPLRGKSNMVSVFVARGRDQKMKMPIVWPMWRSVPRVAIYLAPAENLFPLFGR